MAALETALALAAQGFPVFPCGSNKRPALRDGHGFHDATTDVGQIKVMFGMAGDLVGCPTGETAGFDVLDIDYRNGGEAWEAEHATRLPETRIIQTQSGGRHYHFRHAPGVRNTAGKVAAGIDVRGDGGYVILPPSVGYRVIHDADLAEWPDWLLDLVLSRPIEPRPVNGHHHAIEIESRRLDGFTKSIQDRVRNASDGAKHFALRNAALSLGGIAAAAGLSDDEATQLLLQSLPGTVKDWKNAAKTIAWGLAHGRNRPIELEERRPTPPRTAPPPNAAAESDIGIPISDERPQDKSEPLLESITLDAIGRQNIAPRAWAYGHYLLFGKTAVLGAVDGGGKGAITTTMILCHVFGQDLLGEKVWRAGHVSILTYEDDETEWHRRIAAACLHYDLDYTMAMWSIHFIRKPGGRVALVAPAREGVIYPDGDAIIAELKATGSTLLIVDPFNHAHMLDDGNNNVMIAKVAAEMDRIADETQAAIMVLHHLRKGSTGQADDLMGATSLRATFRSSRILSRMTQDEAEALNIEEGWRYIRIKGSKENYAPPPDKATWYMLASVPLGNQSELYPDGDNIAVATTWAPPSPWDGLPMDVVVRALEQIERGPSDGEFYTGSRRGRSNNRWAGAVLVEMAKRQPDNCGLIVAEWIRNGLLIEGNYQSPKEGKVLACVRVDPGKLADMKKTASPPSQWDC